MDNKVTIGVPIYKGERYLEETLHSIQRQTYKSFDVVMSLDGPDPVCEAICEKFLGDSRFRMIVQPNRLGWVGNRNWLTNRVKSGFWYYHQQDDLTDDSYLEVLVDHALRYPSAAIVYCDIWPFGRVDGPVYSAPSVVGVTPFTRVLTMLHEHFPAFAFRGLTRVDAMRTAGPVGQNDVDNVGVDITWLTAIARAGELHRVPFVLYKKRYHDQNTESRWWNISQEDRLRYWSRHCVDMLGQALEIKGSPEQARILWSAAVAKLTAPEAAGHFLNLSEVRSDNRADLLRSFLNTALSLYADRLCVWLDADRDAIVDWSKKSFWVPQVVPMTIKNYGPDCVDCGQPFNVSRTAARDYGFWPTGDCRPKRSCVSTAVILRPS